MRPVEGTVGATDRFFSRTWFFSTFKRSPVGSLLVSFSTRSGLVTGVIVLGVLLDFVEDTGKEANLLCRSSVLSSEIVVFERLLYNFEAQSELGVLSSRFLLFSFSELELVLGDMS